MPLSSASTSLKTNWKIPFLVLGLALFVFVLWRLGLHTLVLSFTEVGWGYGVILFWPLTYYFFYTLGWYLLLRGETSTVGFYLLFKARLVGEAVNYLTPLGTFGGEPFRTLYLRHEAPLPITVATVIVDRTLYLVATLVFTLLGILLSFFILDLSPAFRIAALLCAGAFAFLAGLLCVAQHLDLLSRLARALSRRGIAQEWIEAKLPKLRLTEETMRDAYRKRPGTVLRAFFCHLLGRAGGTVEIWIMLALLGAFSSNSPWLEGGAALSGLPLSQQLAFSLLIAVFVIVINFAFFMFPSQLGVAEGSTALLFQLLGFSPGLGVSLQIVRRVKSLAYIAIGLSISALSQKGAAGLNPEEPAKSSSALR